MDIGDMDVEEFGQRWRRARRNFERINQIKLRREVSGPRLSPVELAEWNLARSEFEAAERQWDEAYRAGVVIVVADDEAAD
jgi:hypothetical protein